MSWSIRHQGSPRVVESLTCAQVIAGLQVGDWDSTDEVQGPGEARWTPLETHPQFSSLIAEIEAAAQTQLIDDSGEQHIDMNPLIDVCLVLLVFFILATTVQMLTYVHPMPTGGVAADRPLPVLPFETVREHMIIVRLRPGPAGAAYRIDDQEVPGSSLLSVIKRRMHLTNRREVVIDARDVEWGDVINVIDAAAGAKVRKVHFKADRQ